MDHYAIRYLMRQAAHPRKLVPDRIRFVHALEVLRCQRCIQTTARHLLVDLRQLLWRDIARYPSPKRRHCTNLRAEAQNVELPSQTSTAYSLS